MEDVDRSFHIQGTPEWYAERLGYFTNSVNHTLLQNGKGGEYFGQGAKTYIRKKVNEILTGRVEEGNAFGMAIDWGYQHEFEALQLYQELTGNTVDECGFEKCNEKQFNDYWGGSPDGRMYKNAINEVKCPFVGSNHLANLALPDQWAFKALHPNYYTQIQGNIFVTDTEFCDFISYDPRPKQLPFRIKIIRINRDDEFITQLKERVSAAQDVLVETLETIIKNAESFEPYLESLKIVA